MASQKGRGMARMGFKRASGRHGGGKVHGHVPKDFRYFLPEKVKLQGLKAMLSAKLAEGMSIGFFFFISNIIILMNVLNNRQNKDF